MQPPPSNNTTTNATIRTATTTFKLLTANRITEDLVNFPNQPSFANNAAFWGTTEKWRIMNTTNGSIQLRDANNLLLANSGVPASVQLFAIDDPAQTNPINFSATYPTSSFSYEITVNGAGNDLNLVWNPVPEPMTILGLAAGGLVFFRCLCRKKGMGQKA